MHIVEYNLHFTCQKEQPLLRINFEIYIFLTLLSLFLKSKYTLLLSVITEDLQQFVGEYVKAINLNRYTKGIYFLEIETNDGVINKKLILQ